MKKVLIIFGGNSFENQVSKASAKCILESIDYNLFEVTAVYIDKENWYLFNEKPNILLEEDNWWCKEKNSINNIISFLKEFDVVFPILHGENGEDGKIQGMLDLFNIKYVGSKTSASVIGMDKELAKLIFQANDIPIVPYHIITSKNLNYGELEKKLNYPLIVKPANGGSSCGITKANNRKELKNAIDIALRYDTKIIVEKYIRGRELECAILETDKIYTSEIGEISFTNDFYDYETKYLNNEAKLIIPAKLPTKTKKQIKQYAKKAFIKIGARNLSRVDFFYDEENKKIYLNEINTIPGFTNSSMYPKLWENQKIFSKELITNLIENA